MATHVCVSTANNSTPRTRCNLWAKSSIGKGIVNLPFCTLIPISQIEIELTTIRVAAAMALAASGVNLAGLSVQNQMVAILSDPLDRPFMAQTRRR